MKPRMLSEGRLVAFALGAVTMLGFLLRTWEIGAKGLWLDEAFSVWLGWQPLGDLLSWLVKIDQHPPLYYTLLHLWIKVAGDSPSNIRMLSAMLGTLTIPVMFLLGRRLIGTPVGLLAALILALSPFHVRLAQETRMYTLLMLNASLAMLALAYCLTDSRRAALPPRRILADPAWIAYMIFTAATLWTHNTAILFPLATSLFVVGAIKMQEGGRIPNAAGPTGASRTQSSDDSMSFGSEHEKQAGVGSGLYLPSLRSWLIVQAGIAVLWLPWLVPFVIQSIGVYREFWVPYPTWQTVIATLEAFLSAMLPVQGPLANAIWAVFGLLIALGVWRLRRRPGVLALLLIVFFVPLVGQWLAGLWRPIFDDRTLIWTTIPLYLTLAVGVSSLCPSTRPRKCSRLTVVAALVLIAAGNLASLHEYYAHFEKEAWKEAAAYVASEVKDDDLLLFNATWAQLPFDYYFRYYNRPAIKHGVPVDLFDRGILEPRMAESDLPRLRDLISDKKRVWLIYSHNWYTDPMNLIPTALSQDLEQLDQRRFKGLEVRLYGIP